MSSNICLFEDIYHPNLLPLVYFRPAFNLRCGILSLKEKVQYAYPKADVNLHCRTYLADYMRLRNPGHLVNDVRPKECLFINGRAVVDAAFAKLIPAEGGDAVFVKDDVVVAARVSGAKLKNLRSHLTGIFSISDFDGLPVHSADVTLIAYPWELIKHNGAQLKADFAAVRKGKKSAPLSAKKLRRVMPLGMSSEKAPQCEKSLTWCRACPTQPPTSFSTAGQPPRSGSEFRCRKPETGSGLDATNRA